MVSNSGISFSGLGSGLDTNAIVRQLVAIERLPIQSLQTRRGTEQRRLDLVGQLGDLVKALKAKAEDLATPEEFFAFTANISNEGAATITTDSNAAQGTHTLDVQRLAATDRWAFDAVSTRDGNLSGTAGEQISFKVGTTDYTLTVDPDNSSLDDIASQIEEMTNGEVSASVVNTGTESSPTYQMVLASENSGEEGRLTDIFSNIGQTAALPGFGVAGNPLTIAYTSPDANGEPTSANNITVGNDALAEINGLLVRRSTNSFSDVLEGVSIDLRSVTDDPASITIEPDRTAVRERIDSFVSAYNEVIDFVGTQNTFTPSEGEDEDGSTGGLLFGDSILSSVKRALQRSLFNQDITTVANDTEGYSTLSLVGLEQDRDGRLSVNSSVFDEKFTENLPALMDLFADTDGFDNGDAEPNTPGYYDDITEDGGLMNRLVREVDQMFGNLDSGDSDFQVQGLFDVRQQAIEASIGRYDDQIERREDRLERFEETLILRFARLEELMGGLNAQGQALTAALGG